MEDRIFELKFAAKSMNQQAKRMEKEEQRHREAVAKAMRAGKRDIAEVKAQIAIAKHHLALNLYRLAGVMEVVSSQLEIGMVSLQVTGQVKGLSESLGKALEDMDVKQIARVMVGFKDQCHDLDVNMQIIQDILGEQESQVTNPEAVSKLIDEVSAEMSFNLGLDMAETPDLDKLREDVGEEVVAERGAPAGDRVAGATAP